MTGNSFGRFFRLSTFGESHGEAIGGIVDGCPAGVEWNEKFIQKELDRRKPGTGFSSSPRQEPDHFEVLSGIYEGKTTGQPIAFLIRNIDQRPQDYEQAEQMIRPGHADFAWKQRYGIFDPRGGGRASARETAARVAAGATAKLFLKKYGVHINAYVLAIGPIQMTEKNWHPVEDIEADPLRCPHKETSSKMQDYLQQLNDEGDTAGGIIRCFVRNCPAGIGNPVFDKLQAALAYAMMSIPAAKGFEYGEGFSAASMKGSQHNDTPEFKNGSIHFVTHHAGGILGGISTGDDIVFNVAFKPVSSIDKPQLTVTYEGKPAIYQPGGRHDITVVPRAVPVVEAMAALVIADQLIEWFALGNYLPENHSD
ncbi:MAG TPA: chorismate synthase [Bacteroidales bacterium]|jgi:chorismate synthase|nr:chorismate synthase [Bacteroidales bacterium]MDI9573631.1 chorismate synthase [Bacteroidota bacterium]OQC61999.1 MAG: Chorismate synthase [Bacteroidetes bacterium ADurb.Bin012]MBP9511039.1 chorismate synthase [Bacteroidales bacterium]MBP9587740.1 chorismate synthase [Bacteroidales bacterium]